MKVIEYGRKMGLDMIQGDHEDAPGPARAQLQLRRCAAHRRPPDHLSPDLRAGGARVQRLRLLHAQALHGRLGQRLPSQHLAVEGRQGRVQGARQRPEEPARLRAQLHVPPRRQEHLHAGGDDPQHAGPGRPLCDRRHHEAPRCAHRIGCSTVNSYRRLWDTGFWAPVFADWGFQNRTTGLRVSAPGRFEYRSVDSMP